jgi:molecular chaperone GrpE
MKETISKTVEFLRDKKLLDVDKDSFKIIHDEAGEVSLNELLEEFAGMCGQNGADSHMRLAAEFDNYKKRTSKEKQDLVNSTKVKMLSSILDMDSDISLALKSITNEEAKEGVSLIASKVDSFLKSQGIESIQTDTYDSEIHEPISVVDIGESKIVDVISKGYTLNGKPFRYPKIILGK